MNRPGVFVDGILPVNFLGGRPWQLNDLSKGTLFCRKRFAIGRSSIQNGRRRNDVTYEKSSAEVVSLSSSLPPRSAKAVLGLATALVFTCAPAQVSALSPADVSGQAYVADLANVLESGEERKISSMLRDLEADVGRKVRVVTQFRADGQYQDRSYWKKKFGLDDESVLVMADPTSPNLFDFGVGMKVSKVLKAGFWNELQSRYGNKFYLRDSGEAQAMISSVEAIDECFRRPEGCRVVPGLASELWALTTVTAALAGIVAGIASNNASRHGGDEGFSLTWAIIYSPLWGILLGAFSFGPILSRTSEIYPLAANGGVFLVFAALAYLSVPRLFSKGPSEEHY